MNRLATWALLVSIAVPARAQTTNLVSANGTGAIGNSFSFNGSISADGRYLAVYSAASNLAPLDANGFADAFVWDRLTGAWENASVSSSGTQANNSASYPTLSADGRYVVFDTSATNLVPNDTNGHFDVFLRDRLNGTTEIVSLSSSGAQGNSNSNAPGPGAISADGRYVVFWSDATNFVASDVNGTEGDVFVRDRQTGATELVSQSTGGAQGNGNTYGGSISADGRYVLFWGDASNLVPGDTNLRPDVFLRDRLAGTTELVSVGAGGVHGNLESEYPLMSPDARFVVFTSRSSNFVPGDTNDKFDVFLRDRQAGTTELVSVSSGGTLGDGDSFGPSVSADGRYVAFMSGATNLVPGDVNGITDVFLRDRQLGTTVLVSRSTNGILGNDASEAPTISADGRFIAFDSYSTNLVAGDTNGSVDEFLYDRTATNFTSLCHPGLDGVIACPCANPPSAPGRGCDNSSATGGAILTAAGTTTLANDTLVFTASGEKPTALSVFSQGTALSSSGIVFGQGIRCATTNLKRLYTKNASGGVASAPSGGDPSVHVRSAALGDSITPGASRYYYVYYRDPAVLGGCPSSSTFNQTQTGQVVWSP
jgi:Tol biopolymer transport system component